MRKPVQLAVLTLGSKAKERRKKKEEEKKKRIARRGDSKGLACHVSRQGSVVGIGVGIRAVTAGYKDTNLWFRYLPT